MDETIRYRGRMFAAPEINRVREVIDSNPGKGRRFISQELCRQWGWIQPNGLLKDMVCRGLLKLLETEGLVVLPPRKQNQPNPFLNRKKPDLIEVDQSGKSHGSSMRMRQAGARTGITVMRGCSPRTKSASSCLGGRGRQAWPGRYEDPLPGYLVVDRYSGYNRALCILQYCYAQSP